MPPGLDLIFMIVAFGAIMYFLMIRPQQKRMKEHQEMVNQLEPGTRVLLTSGIFATILHTGERQMIVELAPGVEVTVVKGHIARVVTGDDEEFEYEDDAAEAGAPVDEPADGAAQGQYAATDEELQAMFDAPDAEKPDSDRDNR